MNFPTAGKPLAPQEFSSLISELQFNEDVKKEAKKQNEEKPEEAAPAPANSSGAGVSEGVNAKILAQGV